MDKCRLESEGKKRSKSAGHISENNSGDDRDNQAQKGALESFTIDVDRGLAVVPAKEATRKKNATYQLLTGGLAIEDRFASLIQPCAPENGVCVSGWPSVDDMRERQKMVVDASDM